MSPEYSTTQQDVVIRDHKRLDRYKKLMRFMWTVYTIYSSKQKKKLKKIQMCLLELHWANKIWDIKLLGHFDLSQIVQGYLKIRTDY